MMHQHSSLFWGFVCAFGVVVWTVDAAQANKGSLKSLFCAGMAVLCLVGCIKIVQ